MTSRSELPRGAREVGRHASRPGCTDPVLFSLSAGRVQQQQQEAGSREQETQQRVSLALVLGFFFRLFIWKFASVWLFY